jgi:hypothetical protein
MAIANAVPFQMLTGPDAAAGVVRLIEGVFQFGKRHPAGVFVARNYCPEQEYGQG